MRTHYHLDFIAILETRCTPALSVGRAKSLGFPNMELVDCEGYSGGIWCLWDHSISSVSVLERHHQFLHLQITSSARCTWTMTIVYASPSCGPRRVLWDHLSWLAPSIQGVASWRRLKWYVAIWGTPICCASSKLPLTVTSRGGWITRT
ncbi:hypothetical protein K1719_009278 [Acacia pycnantha]|nr:hypothetical protein K1719_009278 [Acacia pycnantha]